MFATDETIAAAGVETRCGPELSVPSVPNAASTPPPPRTARVPSTASDPAGEKSSERPDRFAARGTHVVRF